MQFYIRNANLHEKAFLVFDYFDRLYHNTI